MMESPNWEIIWQERIIKKINVDELIKKGDLRNYLEEELEAGHYIKSKRQKTSHFVNTKDVLLEHIHKSDGYSEADETVKVLPIKIEQIKKKIKFWFSKDIIEKRKDIEKEKAREKIPAIGSANSVEEIKSILKPIPSFARETLRKWANNRIKYLIRVGKLPQGTKLPIIR